MHKSDLVGAVAPAANTSRTAAGRLGDRFTDAVREGLATGASVALAGFGTFAVTERRACQSRTPRTGQLVAIKASKVYRLPGSRSAPIRPRR
ncbi:MAG: HU family DNA-binding protein [Desulfobulbaceae bacterium]|nr:HU family DNA-binding protein [Desulfobulbaceae bacterium]